MQTTANPERRRAPRDPSDELLGLVHAATIGELPTGLWDRLTPGEGIALSNAVSERRRSQT